MPRNTGAGIIIAGFGFLLCFALVWHIWWLAIAGFAGVIATFIVRTYDRDVDYYVPAAEVARIEQARMMPPQNMVKRINPISGQQEVA